jgi:hypothetical protein
MSIDGDQLPVVETLLPSGNKADVLTALGEV